ncbi:MAG: hypothetical protein ACI4MB_05405 [Candidatus Coproplasma sp.]
MTAKQFFKGKAFKSIVVLLCVLLVSGILLSVCWGFLEVTDEERFNRKINAMYGGETVTAVEQDISQKNTSVSGAYVQNVWKIEEKKDYLVQAASRGYGGDIICWVAVSLDNDMKSVTGIRKVIKYAVKDAAELIGNIGEEVYEKFSTDYVDGKEFAYGTEGNSEYINTGASHTLSAICNCVNGSVGFVKAYASGVDINDPLEGLTHTDKIDGDKTDWSSENGVVTYNVVTQSNGQAKAFTLTIKVAKENDVAVITEYTIVTNGSTNGYDEEMAEQANDLTGKKLADVEGYLADTAVGGALMTGATKSNTLCYKAAAFALANYDTCLTTPKGGN